MSKIIKMISCGVQNIGLLRQRSFKRRIRPHILPSTRLRWSRIGGRLTSSAEKVVDKNGREQQRTVACHVR